MKVRTFLPSLLAMSTIYFPIAAYHEATLKELFAARGITFGMAGEYSSFDSSVQSPLIYKHAATFTSEVSMKMLYTQPIYGQWEYSYADSLVEECQLNNIALHGHCIVWHMEYPAWLDVTLGNATIEERYAILANHVERMMRHFAPSCASIDVVNELQPAVEADCGGFGYYLGLSAGRFAFTEARKYSGDCKLYYNSFFNTDADADYAIRLLDVSDGIGVQLHLDTWNDNTARFDRIRRMADACKAQGKSIRFSEVSVRKQDGEDMMAAALVYRDIVRLALEYPQTIVNFTTWGVKGKTWNGGYLLFDTYGKPNTCYSLVVKELLRKE